MMVYYHVYIEYLDEEKKRWRKLVCGYTKKQLDTITIPFSESNSLLFSGRIIEPLRIKLIEIYESEEREAKNIHLPDGSLLIDISENTDYALNCLRQGKIKGTYLCTPDVITKVPSDRAKKTSGKVVSKKQKVFIVHGRTEAPALLLQKYLRDKLNVDAEIFDDIKQKLGSKTIIEVLDYIQKNAFYAFIIVTPDDCGCLGEEIQDFYKKYVGKQKEEISIICNSLKCLKTRARQNVVFEFGLFLGTLGRDNVCCLLKENTEERPSDIDGILYVSFNKSIKETFAEITEKLKEAGKNILF